MGTRKIVWMVRLLAVLLVGLAAACAGRKPPLAAPAPPPSPPVAAAPAAPGPVEAVREAPVVAPAPVPEDAISSRSLDELNRDSPLSPIFFDYDSADVSPAGRATLDADAASLRKYPTWVITIEGHCDERGTAEYNLALGERRAVAVRSYLVSLGIDARRLRTVSYGKEFPFDPGHTETAWSRNRRAHFIITAK
jgi:peptidoglycan-associated lipoprotein